MRILFPRILAVFALLVCVAEIGFEVCLVDSRVTVLDFPTMIMSKTSTKYLNYKLIK